MGKLSAGDGNVKKGTYLNAIDSFRRNIIGNFNDMDFENANRRDEVEREIENMKIHLRNMQNSLDSIYFEE